MSYYKLEHQLMVKKNMMELVTEKKVKGDK